MPAEISNAFACALCQAVGVPANLVSRVTVDATGGQVLKINFELTPVIRSEDYSAIVQALMTDAKNVSVAVRMTPLDTTSLTDHEQHSMSLPMLE